MGKTGGDQNLQGQEGGKSRDGGSQVEGQGLKATGEKLVSFVHGEIAKGGDAGVREVAAVSDITPQRAQEALLNSSRLAMSLPVDVLTNFIDGSRGVFEKTLLSSIDPRDPATRDAVMSTLEQAFRTQAT